MQLLTTLTAEYTKGRPVRQGFRHEFSRSGFTVLKSMVIVKLSGGFFLKSGLDSVIIGTVIRRIRKTGDGAVGIWGILKRAKRESQPFLRSSDANEQAKNGHLGPKIMGRCPVVGPITVWCISRPG